MLHSSIGLHLGCFHLAVIVNKLGETWVVGTYLFEYLLSLFGVIPEVELLDHRVVLPVIF